MNERISKIRKIATIIFIGITALGLVISYGFAFLCGSIITSEQYGKIMNTFAVIYCLMAFIYMMLMLFGKLFSALYQAFGDRLMLLGKKSATAFLVSAEKADNGATIITAEFTDNKDGSRRTAEIRTFDMFVISEFTSNGSCYITYKIDDFGNVTSVTAHRGRETGFPFVGVAFAILFIIAIIFCIWLFSIFYIQVLVEWLK